jgi:YggT family protein
MLLLLQVIDVVFKIYSVLIIIYVLSSWLPQLQQYAFGVVLGKVVEPYLSVFRRFIPPLGMIDLSPIIALFALQFVYRGLISLLGFIVSPGSLF